VNGRPDCPVSEAEGFFKVKLLRCGLKGPPRPLFDVVVFVVVHYISVD